MVERKPPEAWTWSHDIESDQIDSLIMPGWHLMRLSSYGKDNHRRFAAVVFKESGPERSYVLDLDAAAIETQLRETGARPVAITIDADGSQRRFSLVLQRGPRHCPAFMSISMRPACTSSSTITTALLTSSRTSWRAFVNML
jgi:hypothetical protein